MHSLFMTALYTLETDKQGLREGIKLTLNVSDYKAVTVENCLL